MITKKRKKELDDKANKLSKELTTDCHFTLYPGYTKEEVEYVANKIKELKQK